MVVDISGSAIIDMYAEIDYLMRHHTAGAINMGKNDLWIAAVAAVTVATSLTTDNDFDPLHDVALNRIYEPPN